MPSFSKPAAVLDGGSSRTKFGLSGHDAPQGVIDSCVGYPKTSMPAIPTGKDFYIGAEAHQKRGLLIRKFAIEHGVVQNLDDMEKIWKHVLDEELGVVVGAEDEAAEDGRGVLMTEPPWNPRENRERTTGMMFESFGTRRFYLGVNAVLSLYASGRTTGVVVDCGGAVSHVVPIYEGYSMPHAVQRFNKGGRDLTDFLCKILFESGINLHTTAERESATVIKEQLCWLAKEGKDFSEESNLWNCRDYAGEPVSSFATRLQAARTFQMASHFRLGAASRAHQLSQHIGAQICEAVLSPRDEMEARGPQQFTMPDQTEVTVHSQAFRCPEVTHQ